MATRYDVNQLLADTRSRISRLTPSQLQEAIAVGALVLDTRSADDRRREGTIAGSFHVPLSVLLWRLDPASESTSPVLNDLHEQKVLVCRDGYSSSWAGATLVDLGFTNVADLDGGFRGWVADGFPIVPVD